MMAITLVLSTSMPAALATVWLWPTARNFCPRRVLITVELNRHRMPIKSHVITGTVMALWRAVLRKISPMAGTSVRTARNRTTPTVTAIRLRLIFLRVY